MPMKWSLNTYRIGDDWEVDDMIETCQKTGYQGIEFLQDFDQPHGLEWDTPQEKYAEVDKKLKGAGMEWASITSCQNFHSDKPEEVAESIKKAKRVIDMAESVGCPQIRCLGDRFDDDSKDRVIKQVGESLGELGDYAKPKNVEVSIEFHSSFTDPDAAIAALKIADKPNVSGIFNCVWKDVTDDTVDAYHDKIAPYITMVHTHGAEGPQWFDYYRKLFIKLNEIGFDGFVSNECAYTGPDKEKVLAVYIGLFCAFSGQPHPVKG